MTEKPRIWSTRPMQSFDSISFMTGSNEIQPKLHKMQKPNAVLLDIFS